MDFGLYLSHPSDAESLETLAAVVEAADERGFRTVWIGEHVALFDDISKSRYPYSSDGRSPFPSDMPWFGPFEILTYLAARTKNIRVGTGICLLPQRNPVYTAKSVSTLDFLSGGRFDFGIGTGWTVEEYEAAGVPFERRGKRADEYIAVMKALWTEETASYSGELYELVAAKQRPAPLQKPHPPIFVGGESNPALRRVARLGDGWFGWGLSADMAEDRIERLKPMLAEHGRDIADVNLVVGSASQGDPENLDKYAAIGVNQFVMRAPLRGTVEENIAELDRYASTFLAAYAG